MAARTPRGTNALLMQAAVASLTLLQDPRVQEQIVNGAATFSAAMRAKAQDRQERSPKAARQRDQQPAIPGEIPPRRRSKKEVLTSPFGLQKLDRRVTNLRTNVELLQGAVGPDAAAALREVEAVVSRLEVAVTMAGNLPLAKRQRAYREIDSVLDKLEKGVFATVME